MKIFRLLFLLLFSGQLYAFTRGSGSQYIMSYGNQKADLSIYITEVSSNSLSVEFHMGTNGLFSIDLWQQFAFEIKENKPINITSGLIMSKDTEFPEQMTSEFFYQNKGVQVQDFLFQSEKSINKYFVGQELVELPAGSVMARHYRKEKEGQVIDFWIASDVKPISLVKLVSKSTKVESNNYVIELSSILKNVKASIDPKKAIPLTKKTRERFLK